MDGARDTVSRKTREYFNKMDTEIKYIKEIKYINQEGDECIYAVDGIDNPKTYPKYLAQHVAQHEMENLGINSPEHWPRDYKIYIGDKWMKFKVEIDFIPSFSATRQD